MSVSMNRFLALLPALLLGSAAIAAPVFNPGGLSEFRVELPRELREFADRGRLSPVTQALVTVAVPADFDPAGEWPIMVISATSDPGFNSSRRLLGAYTEPALAAGWVLIAADPAEKISVEDDDVLLRFALNTAALAALQLQWPRAGRAPLGFGGFSGGAKYSGSLAAAFVSQGRRVIGVYLAGINQESLVSAGRQFKVMNEAFKRIPVFLLAGEQDEVATPADHRGVQADMQDAGFKHVRLEYFPGSHAVETAPLRRALEWFHETASQPAGAN
jgi:predicted esterase